MDPFPVAHYKYLRSRAWVGENPPLRAFINAVALKAFVGSHYL